jgi:hypothetical protein
MANIGINRERVPVVVVERSRTKETFMYRLPVKVNGTNMRESFIWAVSWLK